MEKLVATIQTHSSTDEDLKQLKAHLSKNAELLLKNINNLDDALSQLDPKTHTLGWLNILAVKLLDPKADKNRTILQITRFIYNCLPVQLRYDPKKFARICRRLAELSIEVQAPIRVVRPLRVALEKLRPTLEHLTPIHADFLMVCLAAKTYKAAVSVVKRDILDVDPEATGVTPRDMLLYFYYGGMILLGLKQFKEALEFFKMGYAAPAVIMSAIMVDSYKKWLLVALLVHGQLPAVPKYTSAVVHRNLKTMCPQYQEFAQAYASHNTDEVHKIAAQHAEVFGKDGNFGLVKQCIQSLYRRNILNLTRTYLTLSLADIHESSKLPTVKQTELSVLKMIESGDLFAVINQKEGNVSFHEDPEEYNTNRMRDTLDSNIHTTIDLAWKLRSADEEISLSAPYLQRTMLHERHGRWGEAEHEFMEMEGGKPPGMGGMMRG